MGNEQSIVRNLDKRTARREYASHFTTTISRFRQEYNERQKSNVDTNNSEASPGENTVRNRDVRVCVRKRPFFQHEKEQGEYDVITAGQKEVVVHDARMHSDMRHMFINHHTFGFDAVFGERASNIQVYEGSVGDIVQKVVQGLAVGTILMYGQTGSGKTYTMTAIHERASLELFEAVELVKEHARTEVTVTVSLVELAGDVCRDMLNRGRPAQLLTGLNGEVQPYPVVEVPVDSSQGLLNMVKFASSLRSTEATGVHDQSSRSHAVCRVFIHRADDDSESMLQLVDLAGTEHRIDSAEHDAARRKECAQINSSLAALKECVRLKASGAQFVPYRKCKLTHMLKAAFTERNATVIIATVSPASKDTEQSLNTLRHACIMDGQGHGESEDGASHVTGGKIVREDVGEIDVGLLARQRKARKKAGLEDEGGGWQKPPPKSEDLLPAKVLAKRAERARAVAERRAIAGLDEESLTVLMTAREDVGVNARQMSRLRRYDASGGNVPPNLEQLAMLLENSHTNQANGSSDDEEHDKDEEGDDIEGLGLLHNEQLKVPAFVMQDMHTQSKAEDREGPRSGVSVAPATAHHSEVDPVKDRHKEAARRRAEAENERKEALQKKMETRDRRSSGRGLEAAAADKGTSQAGCGPTLMAPTSQKARVVQSDRGEDSEMVALRAQVEEIMEQLQEKGISEAKTFGLKKKLASTRASMLRRERKLEEERKKLQQQALDIAAAAQAAAAARRAEEESAQDMGWPAPEVHSSFLKENDAGLNSSAYVSVQQQQAQGMREGPRIDAPRTKSRLGASSNVATKRPSSGIAPRDVSSTCGVKAQPNVKQGKRPIPKPVAPVPRTRSWQDPISGGAFSDQSPRQEQGWSQSTGPGVRAGDIQDGSQGFVAYGKGLTEAVVMMLEEDAVAFAGVLKIRALKRSVGAWRQQADIAAMSCLNR